jgi:hypothetical protein
MKVVIRNEHGEYLRRISPDGTPHFSAAPLDAWQWDWSEEEVAGQLKQIQNRFGVEWTAETVFGAKT